MLDELLMPQMAQDKRKRRNSDGNLVNVGNADADGANVNRWNPDNSNDNLGVAFSRSFGPRPNRRGFLVYLFVIIFMFYPATKHATNFLKACL